MATFSEDGEFLGALAAGTRLHRYELLSVLGHGQFGITYLARDTELGREVAIKEYLPVALALRKDGTTVAPRSSALKDDFIWGRERFLEEARTLATFDHVPAIVRVYDFMEANGTAYMVMALVRGETLEERLKRDGPLPGPIIERMLERLVEGLEEVHNAGFLHRDVKPANIILDARSNPTLIDFGAARISLAGRTATMTAIYTPRYAAVEQEDTTSKLGPWTDIYCLSATLYHAITGQPPPRAITRALNDTYKPLVELAPTGISRRVVAAIDWGLAFRPDERPQSIAGWRRELLRTDDASAQGHANEDGGATIVGPLVAPRSTLGPPTAPHVAPQKLPSPASSTAPPLPGVAASLPRRPDRRVLFGGIGLVFVLLAAGGYWTFAPKAGQTIIVDPQAEQEGKLRSEAEARKKAEIEAKQQSEATARQKAEAEIRERAEAEAREKAEARRRVEAEARQKAETEAAEAAARQKAEMEAKERAEAEARQRAEAKAKQRAEVQQRAEAARQRAEASARQGAEQEARQRTASAPATGSAGTAATSKTVDAIKARGTFICGTAASFPGFAYQDSQGKWTGLDVDACKAVAAALFGNAEKVKYVPLLAQQRFTALLSGEIDLLARASVWTLTRDTAVGLDFVGINYYDGQGFMVNKKLGVKSARELNGATVCVTPGTTTELNLADYFRANRMTFKPVLIEKVEETRAAFFAGRCDVYTTDASALYSIRAAFAPNPTDYVILPEIISKEPLGLAVRHGDHRFADIVRWSLRAMVEAEEYGITSKNVDEMLKSEHPAVKRILGVTPGMGKALGIDEKWAYNIIKQVGNYGESFDRNFGSGSLLKSERGLNELWTRGGLQYAPPIR